MRSAWLAGSLAVLALGTLLRLAVRPVDTAAVSAALLAILLWLGAWCCALLVLSPRGAFVVALAAMLVLDFAALPARSIVEYDDRVALYRAGQELVVRRPPGGSQTQLVLQVEAVFDGAEPAFALDGWSCPFRRGVQRVVLQVPGGASEVSLRLTGSPNREREYLIVYTSQTGEPRGDAVVCH